MKFRLAMMLALLTLALIFAVQNAAMVEIKLLFWTIDFPRSLLIFLMLLVGMVIGWSSRIIFRRARKPESEST